MKTKTYQVEYNRKIYSLEGFANDKLIDIDCKIGGYMVSLWYSPSDQTEPHYYAIHELNNGRAFSRIYRTRREAVLFAAMLDFELPETLPEQLVTVFNAAICTLKTSTP